MLARIRSQRFSAFEVIVIDDGSSEDTRAGYASLWSSLDDRFTLIQLGSPDGPGIGPAVARNLGMQNACGTILTFCDDDDFWTSDDHLAMMAEVFDADPQLDLYISNQCAVSCDGVLQRRDWLPALSDIVSKKTRTHAYGYRLSVDELVGAGGFAQLNILAVSAATAQAVGGFWFRTTYEEDRDFFWRAADMARSVFYNPAPVAQHNVPDPARRNNLSLTFTQAERWMMSVLVSQHIAMNVRSPAIRALCMSYEGDILRRLSQSLSGEGKHALGLHYARLALAARASLKWALYTMALTWRQMLRRNPA